MTDNREDMIEIQDNDIEMDTNDNTIENMKQNTTIMRNNTVLSSDKEDAFLSDPNTIPPTPVRQTSSQNTSPDVQMTKVTQAKSFPFNPLTFQSREEIGQRVLITHFKSIPFKNRGQP